jgi:hypothetical protein
MFTPSKQSLSATETLIAKLHQLNDLISALIKMLEVMNKKNVEVPMPSWIMNKTIESTQSISQIGLLCRTALDKANSAALQAKQRRRLKGQEADSSDPLRIKGGGSDEGT